MSGSSASCRRRRLSTARSRSASRWNAGSSICGVSICAMSSFACDRVEDERVVGRAEEARRDGVVGVMVDLAERGERRQVGRAGPQLARRRCRTSDTRRCRSAGAGCRSASTSAPGAWSPGLFIVVTERMIVYLSAMLRQPRHQLADVEAGHVRLDRPELAAVVDRANRASCRTCRCAAARRPSRRRSSASAARARGRPWRRERDRMSSRLTPHSDAPPMRRKSRPVRCVLHERVPRDIQARW